MSYGRTTIAALSYLLSNNLATRQPIAPPPQNECRLGNSTAAIRQSLDRCNVRVKPPPSDGICPTKLYSTNRNVDEENLARLGDLPGQLHTFTAADEFKGAPSSTIDLYKKPLPAPPCTRTPSVPQP